MSEKYLITAPLLLALKLRYRLFSSSSLALQFFVIFFEVGSDDALGPGVLGAARMGLALSHGAVPAGCAGHAMTA
jgi:hypothetical protein